MLVNKINYGVSLFRNYSNWISIIFCRFFKLPIKKIILRRGPVIIGGDKSLVIDIVDEIFIRRVYNPLYLSIEPNDIVVDIGANIGVFSIYSALNGAKKIFSVEPLKENLEFITENFRINKLNSPVLVNIAISDTNGLLKLYLPGYDSHGMLFNHINGQRINKYQNVYGTKFTSFLKKYKISRIDFLKIDCEGGEGFIFSNPNKSDWKHIKKISIEYHDGVSVLDHRAIVKKLMSFGYKTKILKSDERYGYIYAWR